MVITPHRPRSGCPINFGLEIFGDRWSLLVLRDMLMQGKSTFSAFQASEEGIASNILADRLARLEQCGLVTQQSDAADRRSIHYRPTDACRKLLPVLVEMAYWGATHDPKTAAPKSFVKGYETDRARLLQILAFGADPTKA
jgi:DNA-binding HxlR family transcriptional regulator